MDLADRLELHELPGRYGDMIDNRDWDGLSRIFTDDAKFVMPRWTVDGLAAIQAFMDAPERKHPRTHLMTNIYVDQEGGATIMYFRLIGMRPDGRIWSLRYRDEVVKTPGGWRVAHRVVTETPYEEPPR
jgi:hypothetical protein